MIQYRIISYNLQALHKMGEEGYILSTIYEGMMIFWKDQKKPRTIRPIEGNGFDRWYRLYPNKKAKQDALKAYSSLTPEEQELAYEKLPEYIAYWKKEKMESYIPYPASWLRGKRWEDILSQVEEIKKQAIVEQKKQEEQEEKTDENKNIIGEWIRDNPEEWQKIRKQAFDEMTPEDKSSFVAKAKHDLNSKRLLYNKLNLI